MRYLALAVALALTTSACESKKLSPERAAATAPKSASAHAQLIDLTTSSTLAAARTSFNAHKGEARFLTLLSPT